MRHRASEGTPRGLDGVLAKARARQTKETEMMQGLRGGRTTLDLLDLRPFLGDRPDQHDVRREVP